jgi:hypothetical protein
MWFPTTLGSRSSPTAAISGSSLGCMPCGGATGCPVASSSITAGRLSRRPVSARSCGYACTSSSPRCSSRSREPWRNGTIEHFNDTFDKRFFRQERFTGLEHLSERASAFERFHNSQHRYSATHGRAPDESDPAAKRAPRAAEQIPAGWPKDGKVEFIRFIRSDQRLRVLGRAIPMPDHSAYQYVTATLDLYLIGQDNLLISDTDGELLTTARGYPPHAAADPPSRRRPQAEWTAAGGTTASSTTSQVGTGPVSSSPAPLRPEIRNLWAAGRVLLCNVLHLDG